MKKILLLLGLINIFSAFAFPKMKLISGGQYKHDESIIVQEDFFMSETKITVAQWSEYIKDANKGSLNSVYSKMKRIIDERDVKIEDSFPVWGITYVQAAEFCNWLSDKKNLKKCYAIEKKDGAIVVKTDYAADGYRLPTFQEWFYVSELWMDRDASYYERVNILKGESTLERDYPYAVDYEASNSFGIKDPLGNIQELCNDYYLKNENLKLLGTKKYGPETFTPDPDQVYFKEPLTAVYVLAGGTHNDTYEKIKDNLIYDINLLSSDYFSFRVVRRK